MGPRGDGAAREVAPGRLANFEGEADDDAADLPLLPPRRSSPRPAARPPAPAPAATPTTAPVAQTPAMPAPPPRGPGRPLSGAGQGHPDRMRASNVQIPVTLLEPLLTRCTAEGRSHGEMIIHALETTHQLLPTLLHPATTGGSLFGARASRATRSADGPFTPLGYRLRNADYRVLDDLVADLGASSRGHLISVALSAYLDDPT